MKTEKRQSPRFLPQAMLLLLPVFFLAASGIFLLNREARLADEEVRSQMQFLANNLAASLHRDLVKEFMHFRNANFVWYAENRSFPDPIHWAEGVDVPKVTEDHRKERALLRQRYPDPDFLSLPRCQLLLIHTNGQLVDPPPLDPFPTPPSWLLDLTPVQRQSWQSLQQTAAASNTTALQAEFKRFLALQPPAPACANAKFLVQSQSSLGLSPAEAIAQWTELASEALGVLTESGQPLSHLAYWRALQRCAKPSDMPELRRQQVRDTLTTRPSLLESRILTELERLAKSGNAAENAQFQAIKVVCAMNEKTRVVLRSFVEQHPPAMWTNHLFWFNSPLGEYLATLEKKDRYIPILEAKEGYIVSLYPREFIRQSLRYVFRASEWSVPDYAGIRLQVANHGFDLTGPDSGGTPSQAPTILGTSSVKADSLAFADPTTLTIYLAKPSHLYASQRIRFLVFAFFICAAAFTAFIGLVHAHSVFRGQIEISEMRGNFVSSVSHELRAPIASIRLMAESLGRGLIRDEARRADYCRLIVQECSRLGTLIGNVLDFSRIDQQRWQFEREPTDVPALVRQTVATLEPYAADKKVRLVIDGDESQFHRLNRDVLLDGRAVQQALVNLIDNAIKHSPPETAVTIQLAIATDGGPIGGISPPSGNLPAKTVLSVSDQGAGIPIEDQERIFEPFYRRGSELRRETAGIGIGLSIVKHVVEAHGGRVYVRSRPGEGCRFVMEFPLSSPLCRAS